MKEVPFRVWLKVERGMSAGTVGSRISNCRRVERHEGDLDAHYDSDELDGLLQRLNPEEPAHGIAIDSRGFGDGPCRGQQPGRTAHRRVPGNGGAARRVGREAGCQNGTAPSVSWIHH